jgi:hypothetical protein
MAAIAFSASSASPPRCGKTGDRTGKAATPGRQSALAWIPTVWAARAAHAGDAGVGNYAVTACFWSWLVTWMLRGLAASCTGMVRVSTPAA